MHVDIAICTYVHSYPAAILYLSNYIIVKTPRPRELSNLVTRRPKAVAPEHSKGTTKGLRVTKSLSSHR